MLSSQEIKKLAGTAAITLSQMVEMRLSGRKESKAPAEVAATAAPLAAKLKRAPAHKHPIKAKGKPMRSAKHGVAR